MMIIPSTVSLFVHSKTNRRGEKFRFVRFPPARPGSHGMKSKSKAKAFGLGRINRAARSS